MKISKRSKITSSKETADRKTDRRIFPTNVRYKGYMIRLDRGGDGYNVYDKHGELEDAGYTSLESAKKLVDELVAENKGHVVEASVNERQKEIDNKIREKIMSIKDVIADYAQSGEFYDSESGRQRFFSIPISRYADSLDYSCYEKQIRSVLPNARVYSNFDDYEIIVDVSRCYENVNSSTEVYSDNSDWTELKSKSVLDSDGFYTDYTLYTNGSTFICMFGDKDIYEPDEAYADYETESEQDAWDWFNSYTGFADEEDEEYEHYDILESTEVINSSQYPYRQNDLNDKLDTLYDRACETFGEDLVNKIVVECGGPTPEENPDSWWSDSLDTEKFYHKLTELFLNNMLNYEDFEDASDMDMFAYNCVAEEYDLPTVEDLDSPGYVYDPQKVWEQFRNKITNISSTTGVYYPNGKEVDVYSSSDIKASMGRYDEYYGQTAAATYGDLIADRLKGKSVSKRRDTANEPGGLIYEANKLGIDMWDLLEALEGMCNEGRAREIDDSTYKILGSSYLADEEDAYDVYSSEDFEDHEDDIDIITI